MESLTPSAFVFVWLVGLKKGWAIPPTSQTGYRISTGIPQRRRTPPEYPPKSGSRSSPDTGIEASTGSSPQDRATSLIGLRRILPDFVANAWPRRKLGHCDQGQPRNPLERRELGPPKVHFVASDSRSQLRPHGIPRAWRPRFRDGNGQAAAGAGFPKPGSFGGTGLATSGNGVTACAPEGGSIWPGLTGGGVKDPVLTISST
jgi:hypothetical protein